MRYTIAGIVLLLAGCATSAGDPQPDATGSETLGGEVVLVTHDSFTLPDELIASFEAESGIELSFVAPGDAGLLVNQLILTKDAPLGDVVYGIDNTYASRAVKEGIFASYTSAHAASITQGISGDWGGVLSPVDFSDVCVNADLGYFERSGIPLPQTLEDLGKPEYAGLLSVPHAGTSSPGLAYLLATVAAMPETWPAYWEGLAEGELRVTAGWSDTYFTDFSAPNYRGSYPLVVSYASSPPSEVIDGEPTTVALLDTCFRQIEYAGVLEGAHNPEGARAVVDWLLSPEVQSALPESMYVYPASTEATVPEEWQEYAPLADSPWSLDPEQIDAHREEWIAEWSDIVAD